MSIPLFLVVAELGRRIVLEFLPKFWLTIPSYLPFYLLGVLVIYAAVKGRHQVTVILPFQMPPDSKLPFCEQTVANTLADAISIIRKEAEEKLRERWQELSGRAIAVRLPGAVRETQAFTAFVSETQRTPGRVSEGGTSSSRASPRKEPRELAGLKLPEAATVPLPPLRRIEVPLRPVVEVKGISHQGLISLARKVRNKELTISGDLVTEDDRFVLVARAGSLGPWQTGSHPSNARGLREACRELALKMLEDLDPTVLAARELARGETAAAHQRLRKLVAHA